jgi:hypothetical protein
MKRITPAESVHALGVGGLRSPEITLWSAWDGDVLLGCGALKVLGPASTALTHPRLKPSRSAPMPCQAAPPGLSTQIQPRRRDAPRMR